MVVASATVEAPDRHMIRCAAAMRAEKLVFLTDVKGIMKDPDDESSPLSTLHINDVDGLIADHTINGGMIPKVDSAVQAVKAGVEKVFFIDGRLSHSLLLEIFTDAGVGTEIAEK